MSLVQGVYFPLLILSGAMVAPAQPANDNFVNRAPIVWPGTNVTIAGTLSNATFEADEPFIEGISSGQTAWWTWTAPSNGIVTLSASGTGFSPLLTVYAGNELANLSLLASNNFLACYEQSAACGCHWRERNQIAFHVARDQAYQITLDSAIVVDAQLQYPGMGTGHYDYWSIQTTNVSTGGPVQMELQFQPAPRNDEFENPIKLAGSRAQIVASNAGATKQFGEPDHLGNSGGSSIWYSWTAPAAGRATLSTNNVPPYLPPSWSGGGVVDVSITIPIGPRDCGNETDQNPPPIFYPVFAAYSGTNLSSVVSANCTPMELDAFPHAVEFDAIKGQTYKIAFDGNSGTTGTVPLFLALTTPASNDKFKNRIKLHGINATATGFNAGATHETSEPTVDGSNGKSVWWSWIAPVSGSVSINLDGSDYAFPIGVFDGTSLSNLNLIVSDPGHVSSGALNSLTSFQGPTSVMFDALQGQIYQIMVPDVSGLTGAIKLKLQAPVIQLPLAQMLARSGNAALLSFMAAPRQVILLQSSIDGSTWKDVRTTMSRQTTVNFVAKPAPTENGPYYRAIVVDYQ